MELDIKEMLELGKKAANTHKSSNNIIEDVARSGSRYMCTCDNLYQQSNE